MAELFIDSGAEISPCGQYRYSLERSWDAGSRILWIMLNPSTADAEQNDPTIERCLRRSVQWGYDGMWVGNLFALRATDPRALYAHEDPVGPDNDAHLAAMAREARIVLCAWGNHGACRHRAQFVRKMLLGLGVMPYCLRLTAAGQPAHPLYLPYSLEPRRWPHPGTTV